LSTVNAIVVEDYKMIADAWGQLLRRTGFFNHVEVLYSPTDLWTYMENLKPNFIFLDINLPGSLDGLEITKMITQDNPEIKIIIISIHNEPAMIRRALDNGAKGYLTKNSGLDEMTAAIEAVSQGKTYLSKDIRPLM
jgi:DNA-binding NarL/FixJ family response regulator